MLACEGEGGYSSLLRVLPAGGINAHAHRMTRQQPIIIIIKQPAITDTVTGTCAGGGARACGRVTARCSSKDMLTFAVRLSVATAVIMLSVTALCERVQELVIGSRRCCGNSGWSGERGIYRPEDTRLAANTQKLMHSSPGCMLSSSVDDSWAMGEGAAWDTQRKRWKARRIHI